MGWNMPYPQARLRLFLVSIILAVGAAQPQECSLILRSATNSCSALDNTSILVNKTLEYVEEGCVQAQNVSEGPELQLLVSSAVRLPAAALSHFQATTGWAVRVTAWDEFAGSLPPLAAASSESQSGGQGSLAAALAASSTTTSKSTADWPEAIRLSYDAWILDSQLLAGMGRRRLLAPPSTLVEPQSYVDLQRATQPLVQLFSASYLYLTAAFPVGFNTLALYGSPHALRHLYADARMRDRLGLCLSSTSATGTGTSSSSSDAASPVESSSSSTVGSSAESSNSSSAERPAGADGGVAASAGIQMPQVWSWEQLIDAVAAVNGTDFDGDGEAEYGICLDVAPGCLGSGLVQAIAASFLQTRGSSDGVLLDPGTVTWRLRTPGFRAALWTLERLLSYSPAAASNSSEPPVCRRLSVGFAEGRCAFTIHTLSHLKASYTWPLRNDSVVYGTRVAALPGSTNVDNGLTDSLEGCTTANCPFAVPLSLGNSTTSSSWNRLLGTAWTLISGGSAGSSTQVLVNVAPLVYGTPVGAVSTATPAAYRSAAAQLLSYLASEGVQRTLFADLESGVVAFRRLASLNATLGVAVSAASSGQQALRSQQLQQQLSDLQGLQSWLWSHGNAAPALRLPGAEQTWPHLDAAVQTLHAGAANDSPSVINDPYADELPDDPHSPAVAEALAALVTALPAVLQGMLPDPNTLRAEYRGSVSYRESPLATLPPTSRTTHRHPVGLIVGLCLGGTSALLAVLAAIALRARRTMIGLRRTSSEGQHSATRRSTTTYVVLDIQGLSGHDVPDGAREQALRLCHDVIKQLARRYNGAPIPVPESELGTIATAVPATDASLLAADVMSSGKPGPNAALAAAIAAGRSSSGAIFHEAGASTWGRESVEVPGHGVGGLVCAIAAVGGSAPGPTRPSHDAGFESGAGPRSRPACWMYDSSYLSMTSRDLEGLPPQGSVQSLQSQNGETWQAGAAATAAAGAGAVGGTGGGTAVASGHHVPAGGGGGYLVAARSLRRAHELSSGGGAPAGAAGCASEQSGSENDAAAAAAAPPGGSQGRAFRPLPVNSACSPSGTGNLSSFDGDTMLSTHPPCSELPGPATGPLQSSTAPTSDLVSGGGAGVPITGGRGICGPNCGPEDVAAALVTEHPDTAAAGPVAELSSAPVDVAALGCSECGSKDSQAPPSCHGRRVLRPVETASSALCKPCTKEPLVAGSLFDLLVQIPSASGCGGTAAVSPVNDSCEAAKQPLARAASQQHEKHLEQKEHEQGQPQAQQQGQQQGQLQQRAVCDDCVSAFNSCAAAKVLAEMGSDAATGMASAAMPMAATTLPPLLEGVASDPCGSPITAHCNGGKRGGGVAPPTVYRARGSLSLPATPLVRRHNGLSPTRLRPMPYTSLVSSPAAAAPTVPSGLRSGGALAAAMAVAKAAGVGSSASALQLPTRMALVFSGVQDAVCFCVHMQAMLTNIRWPSEVLELPSCQPIAVRARALGGDSNNGSSNNNNNNNNNKQGAAGAGGGGGGGGGAATASGGGAGGATAGDAARSGGGTHPAGGDAGSGGGVVVASTQSSFMVASPSPFGPSSAVDRMRSLIAGGVKGRSGRVLRPLHMPPRLVSTAASTREFDRSAISVSRFASTAAAIPSGGGGGFSGTQQYDTPGTLAAYPSTGVAFSGLSGGQPPSTGPWATGCQGMSTASSRTASATTANWAPAPHLSGSFASGGGAQMAATTTVLQQPEVNAVVGLYGSSASGSAAPPRSPLGRSSRSGVSGIAGSLSPVHGSTFISTPHSAASLPLPRLVALQGAAAPSGLRATATNAAGAMPAIAGGTAINRTSVSSMLLPRPSHERTGWRGGAPVQSDPEPDVLAATGLIEVGAGPNSQSTFDGHQFLSAPALASEAPLSLPQPPIVEAAAAQAALVRDGRKSMTEWAVASLISGDDGDGDGQLSPVAEREKPYTVGVMDLEVDPRVDRSLRSGKPRPPPPSPPTGLGAGGGAGYRVEARDPASVSCSGSHTVTGIGSESSCLTTYQAITLTHLQKVVQDQQQQVPSATPSAHFPALSVPAAAGAMAARTHQQQQLLLQAHHAQHTQKQQSSASALMSLMPMNATNSSSYDSSAITLTLAAGGGGGGAASVAVAVASSLYGTTAVTGTVEQDTVSNSFSLTSVNLAASQAGFGGGASGPMLWMRGGGGHARSSAGPLAEGTEQEPDGGDGAGDPSNRASRASVLTPTAAAMVTEAVTTQPISIGPIAAAARSSAGSHGVAYSASPRAAPQLTRGSAAIVPGSTPQDAMCSVSPFHTGNAWDFMPPPKHQPQHLDGAAPGSQGRGGVLDPAPTTPTDRVAGVDADVLAGAVSLPPQPPHLTAGYAMHYSSPLDVLEGDDREAGCGHDFGTLSANLYRLPALRASEGAAAPGTGAAVPGFAAAGSAAAAGAGAAGGGGGAEVVGGHGAGAHGVRCGSGWHGGRAGATGAGGSSGLGVRSFGEQVGLTFEALEGLDRMYGEEGLTVIFRGPRVVCGISTWQFGDDDHTETFNRDVTGRGVPLGAGGIGRHDDEQITMVPADLIGGLASGIGGCTDGASLAATTPQREPAAEAVISGLVSGPPGVTSGTDAAACARVGNDDGAGAAPPAGCQSNDTVTTLSLPPPPPLPPRRPLPGAACRSSPPNPLFHHAYGDAAAAASASTAADPAVMDHRPLPYERPDVVALRASLEAPTSAFASHPPLAATASAASTAAAVAESVIPNARGGDGGLQPPPAAHLSTRAPCSFDSVTAAGVTAGGVTAGGVTAGGGSGGGGGGGGGIYTSHCALATAGGGTYIPAGAGGGEITPGANGLPTRVSAARRWRRRWLPAALRRALAICESGQGGFVLLDGATYSASSQEALQEQCMILHMGDYVLSGSPNPLDLYLALDFAHLARLCYLRPLAAEQLSLGLLSAPVSAATICFSLVVGLQTLMAWNSEVAKAALGVLREMALPALLRHGGYLVEDTEGLLLTAFPSSRAALAWALECQEAVKYLEWPDKLLTHVLAESVYVDEDLSPPGADGAGGHGGGVEHEDHVQAPRTAATTAGHGYQHQHHSQPLHPLSQQFLSGTAPAAASGAGRRSDTGPALGPGGCGVRPRRHLVFRGLRLKSGLDCGDVLARVHTTTGRMTYRGRVMNRAARIAGLATAGQVLCSRGLWDDSGLDQNPELCPRALAVGESMGEMALKGLSAKMEVINCIRILRSEMVQPPAGGVLLDLGPMLPNHHTGLDVPLVGPTAVAGTSGSGGLGASERPLGSGRVAASAGGALSPVLMQAVPLLSDSESGSEKDSGSGAVAAAAVAAVADEDDLLVEGAPAGAHGTGSPAGTAARGGFKALEHRISLPLEDGEKAEGAVRTSGGTRPSATQVYDTSGAVVPAAANGGGSSNNAVLAAAAVAAARVRRASLLQSSRYNYSGGMPLERAGGNSAAMAAAAVAAAAGIRHGLSSGRIPSPDDEDDIADRLVAGYSSDGSDGDGSGSEGAGDSDGGGSQGERASVTALGRSATPGPGVAALHGMLRRQRPPGPAAAKTLASASVGQAHGRSGSVSGVGPAAAIGGGTAAGGKLATAAAANIKRAFLGLRRSGREEQVGAGAAGGGGVGVAGGGGGTGSDSEEESIAAGCPDERLSELPRTSKAPGLGRNSSALTAIAAGGGGSRAVVASPRVRRPPTRSRSVLSKPTQWTFGAGPAGGGAGATNPAAPPAAGGGGGVRLLDRLRSLAYTGGRGLLGSKPARGAAEDDDFYDMADDDPSRFQPMASANSEFFTSRNVSPLLPTACLRAGTLSITQRSGSPVTTTTTTTTAGGGGSASGTRSRNLVSPIVGRSTPSFTRSFLSRTNSRRDGGGVGSDVAGGGGQNGDRPGLMAEMSMTSMSLRRHIPVNQLLGMGVGGVSASGGVSGGGGMDLRRSVPRTALDGSSECDTEAGGAASRPAAATAGAATGLGHGRGSPLLRQMRKDQASPLPPRQLPGGSVGGGVAGVGGMEPAAAAAAAAGTAAATVAVAPDPEVLRSQTWLMRKASRRALINIPLGFDIQEDEGEHEAEEAETEADTATNNFADLRVGSDIGRFATPRTGSTAVAAMQSRLASFTSSFLHRSRSRRQHQDPSASGCSNTDSPAPVTLSGSNHRLPVSAMGGAAAGPPASAVRPRVHDGVMATAVIGTTERTAVTTRRSMDEPRPPRFGVRHESLRRASALGPPLCSKDGGRLSSSFTALPSKDGTAGATMPGSLSGSRHPQVESPGTGIPQMQLQQYQSTNTNANANARGYRHAGSGLVVQRIPSRRVGTPGGSGRHAEFSPVGRVASAAGSASQLLDGCAGLEASAKAAGGIVGGAGAGAGGRAGFLNSLHSFLGLLPQAAALPNAGGAGAATSSNLAPGTNLPPQTQPSSSAGIGGIWSSVGRASRRRSNQPVGQEELAAVAEHGNARRGSARAGADDAHTHAEYGGSTTAASHRRRSLLVTHDEPAEYGSGTGGAGGSRAAASTALRQQRRRSVIEVSGNVMTLNAGSSYAAAGWPMDVENESDGGGGAGATGNDPLDVDGNLGLGRYMALCGSDIIAPEILAGGGALLRSNSTAVAETSWSATRTAPRRRRSQRSLLTGALAPVVAGGGSGSGGSTGAKVIPDPSDHSNTTPRRRLSGLRRGHSSNLGTAAAGPAAGPSTLRKPPSQHLDTQQPGGLPSGSGLRSGSGAELGTGPGRLRSSSGNVALTPQEGGSVHSGSGGAGFARIVRGLSGLLARGSPTRTPLPGSPNRSNRGVSATSGQRYGSGPPDGSGEGAVGATLAEGAAREGSLRAGRQGSDGGPPSGRLLRPTLSKSRHGTPSPAVTAAVLPVAGFPRAGARRLMPELARSTRGLVGRVLSVRSGGKSDGTGAGSCSEGESAGMASDGADSRCLLVGTSPDRSRGLLHVVAVSLPEAV